MAIYFIDSGDASKQSIPYEDEENQDISLYKLPKEMTILFLL